MNPDRHHAGSAPSRHAQRGAAAPWIFAGFLAVAGFFFVTEHRAHLMGALPFVLLALCPLMHLFHGHGRHGHGRGSGADRERGASTGSDGGRAAPPAGPLPPRARRTRCKEIAMANSNPRGAATPSEKSLDIATVGRSIVARP